MARIVVVILPPEPEEDYTNIRGQYGVTGEISKYIEKLIKIDDNLYTWYETNKSAIEEAEKETNSSREKIIKDFLHLTYQVYSLHVSVANILRIHLHDCAHNTTEQSEDWLGAFIVSLCAFNEYSYRRALNLPVTLNEDEWKYETQPGLVFPHFVNLVENGTKNPYKKWMDDKKQIVESLDSIYKRAK